METIKEADAATAVEPQTITPRAGLYLCTRSSAYGEKPCEEAFPVLVVNTDTRTVDDPKKIAAHLGRDGGWYSEGTNHRVENGMIKRDLGLRRLWAVELSDIQAFVDKHGDCVVGRNIDGFCTIEIYDDYRE